jgi:hypothetical protein
LPARTRLVKHAGSQPPKYVRDAASSTAAK